jgi:hypothetical protein
MASSRASTQTARPAASAGPVPGCWGGLQAAEQLADGRAAAVVQAAQEGSEGGLGEGGGGVAGGIAAQERDGGWRVQLVEQPDGAGEAAFQLAGELVDQRDPGLDQVLAGARQRPQDLGRLAVWGERGQAVAVGAQHISQQQGVGGIGLGPAGPIPAAQALDLPRGDYHHAQVGLQHGFHQRAVGAFDRHAGHPEGAQTLAEPGKALAGVGNLEAGTELAGLVNHADRMGLGRPVDTGVAQLGKLLHLAAPSCQDRGTAGVGALGRLLIAWRSRLHIPRAGRSAPARREPQIS